MESGIIGVIGVIVGASITGFFTSRNNSKNIFVQTVTKERATWREKLRKETAEFCKIGYALSCPDNKDNDAANEQQKSLSCQDKKDNDVANEQSPMNIHRLRELGVLIRLRMNPNPKKDKDRVCGVICGIKERVREIICGTKEVAYKRNPNPDEDWDSQVINDTKKVAYKLSHGEKNHQEIVGLLAKVEGNVQKLLKEAWEVSKEEARTGKLKLSKQKEAKTGKLAQSKQDEENQCECISGKM